MKNKKNNSKIKVGINASFLRKISTGIGQVTINLLKEFQKLQKDKVHFILYAEEDFSKDIKFSENFEKRIFLPLYKRDDLIRKIWWEKFLLPKKVLKDNCDIFLSLYQCPTIFRNSLIHVMIVHDIVPKIFPNYYLNNLRKKIYWSLTEKGIENSEKIIAVSKQTEKDLINYMGIDGGKISVNYNDVGEIFKKKITVKESARVLKKYKIKPGYILAGGGYEIRKNVEGVVNAYKILLERNKKEHFLHDFPKLVIYGKVLPKKLKLATDIEGLLKKLNLTEKVKVLGEVPEKDMPAIFENCLVFVYPSFYEGFGMPVLEAMNIGKPVITSKVSSMPEVGGDGVLYCNPKDVSDIAMVIKNVILKRDLQEALKIRARIQAKKFSWDKFSKKIRSIFSKN